MPDLLEELGFTDGGFEPIEFSPQEPQPIPVDENYAPTEYSPAISELTSPPRRGGRSRRSLELERDAINRGFEDPTRGDTLESLSGWDRAMLGIGQAGGALQSQLGGVRTFLDNDVEGRPMMEAGRRTQQEYVDLGDVGGGQDIGGDVVQNLTQQVVSSAAPSLAAGLFGGVPGMVAMAAAQTAGSVMDEAIGSYEDQGYSREDSIKMARPVAAITGAITAGLTALMPGGTEALVQRIVTRTIAPGAARNLVFEIAKEALKEFPEEFADQLAQGIAERWSYRPETSWKDIVSEAFQAGSMGSAIGLGVGTVGQAANLARTDRSPQQDHVDALVEQARQEQASAEIPAETPVIPTEPISGPEAVQNEPAEPVATDRFDELMASAEAPAVETPVTDSSGFRTLETGLPEAPSVQVQTQPEVDIQSGAPSGVETAILSPGTQETPANLEVPSSAEVLPDSSQSVPVSEPSPVPTVDEFLSDPPADDNPFPLENIAPAPDNQVGVSRKRKQTAAMSAERPFDIIDWLEGAGKIRSLGPKEQSDYGDLWRAAQKVAPHLFSKTGSQPDTQAQAYSDERGFTDKYAFGPEQLLQQIVNDHGARAGFREQNARNNREARQDENFREVAIQGKRRDPSKARPQNVDDLSEGDRFKVQGQQFEVDRVNYRDESQEEIKSVRLVDGPKFGTQTVGQGAVLNIDKKTLRKAAGSLDESAGPAPEPSTETAARGVEQVRETIQKSNLSDASKRVANAVLDNPVFNGAAWDKLEFRFSSDLAPGLVGSRNEWLVRVREDAKPTVVPEELFHVLFDLLPESDKAAVEAVRRAEVPTDAPEAIRNGVMSTKQFMDGGHDKSLYQYRSPSEFMAMMFSDKAAREALPEGVWARIQAFFRGLIESVKRAVGLEDQMDSLYRRVLAGEFTPNPDGMLSVEEEGSYSRDAEAATNAETFAKVKGHEEIEGNSQSAQARDIVSFLEKHGVTAAAPSIHQSFKTGKWQAIAGAGERLLGGVKRTYREVKAAITEPWQKAQFARETATHVLQFDDNLKESIARGAAAAEQMTGKPMKARLEKINDKLSEKTLRESNLNIEKSVMKTALRKATAALENEAKNDQEIAELQGEINAINDASNSTVAMEQLLEDMTAKLNGTSDGEIALREGAAPRSIASLYRKTKKSLDEPVTNDNLIRWASYLLSVSPDLRDQLHALHLARDSQIRKQMNAYQIRVMADMQQNPVQAVETMLRQREKSVTQMNKAEWAWHRLNRELTKELAALQRVVDAGKMAGAIDSDPDYQSFRTEVLKDFGYAGHQNAKPFQTDANAIFTSPAGTSVDLSNETMVGSKSLFNAKAQQMEKFLAETEEWLAENPEHVDWNRFRMQKEVVQDYYYTHAVLNPNDKIGLPFFRWSMSIPQRVVDRVGGRMAGMARKALSQWDRVYHASRRINDKATAELAALQIRAMRSHGIKWGMLNRQGLGSAAQTYVAQVMNELNASWQRQGGGLDVGDKLESGQLVTPEDIALVEAQAKWSWQAINTVAHLDKQLTADTLAALKNGRSTYRNTLQTVRYMMPRLFNYDLGNFIGKDFSAAYKSGNWAAVEKQLNDVFPLVGKSLVGDRSPDFAKATVLDEAGVMAQVADEMKGDDSIATIDDLVARLAELSGLDAEEEVKPMILHEFGRIVSQWRTALDNSLKASEVDTTKSGDSKNAFTQSRDLTIAPHAFYHVGFHNSEDVARFSAGMHAVARDRVIDAWRAMIADLERQESEFKRRVQEMKLRGVENPENLAKAERAMERNNGENFDAWEDLDGRLQDARKALDRMTADRLDDGFDYLLQRSLGNLVGALVANSLTTLRNVSPIFLARTLRNMGMSWTTAVLKSAYYTTDSALRAAVATAAELPPMAWRFLGSIPKSFAGDKNAPALLRVYHGMVREIIDTFTNRVPRRLKNIVAAENAGVLNLPDKVTEWDNQMFGSLWSKGRIPAKDLSNGQKVLISPLVALFESGVMPVLGSAFPALGDLTANQAVLLAMKGRFGPRGIADDLQQLHKRFKDGKRAFDFSDLKNPINRFNGKELGINHDILIQRRRFFQQAGIDFDQKATEYLKALESGEAKPEFLTDAELDRISSTAIDLSNRSSPSGSALAFQEASKVAKFFSPLMGFPSRMLGTWSQMLSIPAQSEKHVTTTKELNLERMQQLAFIGLFVVLASLMAGGASKIPEELIARAWKKIAFNQDTAARLPWQEEGTNRKLWNFARMAIESVPFLSIVGNGIIPNNMPARASYTPSLVALNVAEGIMDYVNGVRSSGDPTYRLNDLIARLIPDTKAILNRVERFEGSRDRDNMVALAKRTGPTELVRKPYGGGATPNITELTPYGRLLESYAMAGNREKFVETYNQAVAKATELGRPDPEKLVNQMFQSRNPVTAAFTNKLTPEQHAAMLGKMSDSERNQFVAGEQAFAAAAEWVGAKTPTFEKTRAAGSPTRKSAGSGGSSRASSQSFGTAAPRRASVQGRISGVSRLRRPRRLTARTSRAASRSVLRRGRRRPVRSLRRARGFR